MVLQRQRQFGMRRGRHLPWVAPSAALSCTSTPFSITVMRAGCVTALPENAGVEDNVVVATRRAPACIHQWRILAVDRPHHTVG